MGQVGNMVPHSVVVGFSVGIAVTIAMTQFGEVLGFKTAVSGGFFAKLRIISENLGQANGSAMFLALPTFMMTRSLLSISIYIPAPLRGHWHRDTAVVNHPGQRRPVADHDQVRKNPDRLPGSVPPEIAGLESAGVL
jgi:MFS superfamily sulfate permease-like transporter